MPLSGQAIAFEFLRTLIHGHAPLAAILADVTVAKLGDTVRIRHVMPFPADFDFSNINEMVVETFEMVLLDHVVRVDFEYPSEAMALPLDEFQDWYIRAPVTGMRAKIDQLLPPGATLVTAPLAMPQTSPGTLAWLQGVVDQDSGLSIRCLCAWDIMRNSYLVRVEMLCGMIGAAYRMTRAEIETVALLREARAELVAQLEVFRLAA